MDEPNNNNNELKEIVIKLLRGNNILSREMVLEIQDREVLHWNYRSLKEIPKEVLLFGNHVRELYLKRNCIQTLNPGISCLKNLTNIYLGANQLTSLPEEIGQLRSLKVLDLSQNFLKEVPKTLGDLVDLRQLILTQNQIEQLPTELGRLKRLLVLELSGNRVVRVPVVLIQGLVSLIELGLDLNPIRILPRNITHLTRLTYLSVCHGDLRTLPGLPFSSLLRTRRELGESPGAQEEDGPQNPFPYPGGGNLNDRPEGEEDHDFDRARTPPFAFRFDGNPHLNYLPYWIPQLLGPNVECYGCGVNLRSQNDQQGTTEFRNDLKNPYSNSNLYLLASPRIEVNFEGRIVTLYLDEIFYKIRRPDSKGPCSLLEIALRKSYNLGGRAFNDPSQNPPNVPANLADILVGGPTAQCSKCHQNIFTEGWPLVFSIPPPPENQNLDQGDLDQNEGVPEGDNNPPQLSPKSISLIYFCTSSCAISFREQNHPIIKSELINWK